ncbi:glycoside hydrolase family 25 protein [Consotaella aegiceratis]|uniref:glycoside hydrolase family 25 protein n=1 Tax=Consotaella aegiceratis TaxID=3097961 RepID=UPI002F419356
MQDAPAAAIAAAIRLACALTATVLLFSAPARADFDQPWKNSDRALVIDAYEFNPIDWKQLISDKRVVGFINKASDGLPPEWNCSGKSGDEALLCKNRWWKYSVTKELYMTRREMAKTLGLKWGAYHLGRPGNPREQADHFIDFAEPEADDLIALDIEDNTDEWMSLQDAEIFANQVKIRTGRYPVLYTNGSTAKWIAQHKATYPLLSRLQLWYARYRDDITGLFPEDTWPTYALWQFSSMHNCNERSCPYRVKGAKSDIDVNVASLDVAGLRAAWPFDGLVEKQDEVPATSPWALVADLGGKARHAMDVVGGALSKAIEASEVQVAAAADRATEDADGSLNTVVAAYGPGAERHAVDPLRLLNQAAFEEHKVGDWKHAAPEVAIPQPRPDAETASKETPAADETKPAVKTASAAPSVLSGLDQAKEEMQAIGSIVSRTYHPVDAAVSAGDRKKSAASRLVPLTKDQKSKLLDIIRAADAQRKSSMLSMPAYVLSQALPHGAERGPRLTSFASAELLPADSVDQRVLMAFETTR